MKVVRALCCSLPVGALIAMLGCDAASPDAVVTLKQMFEQRPDVTYSDNAFFDVLGFLAPADADAHAVGIRRVAWLEKLYAHRESAGTDPDAPTVDTNSQRSQAMSQIVDACRAAIARACASALERVQSGAPLSGIESLLIARYQQMQRRSGWREIGVMYRGAPTVPYHGAIEAQRLMLIRLREVAAAGDTEKIRAVLGRDLAFWRGVLGSSYTLISKMIALAAIRQHFMFASFVLRDLPKERAMEAIPAQWREEFTLRELSMLRPMSGELVMAESLMQGRAEDRVPSAPDTGPEGVLDKLTPRERRQPNLREIASTYLSAAEAFQVPLREYEAVAASAVGKRAHTTMGWNVGEYALRVGSAEGMRRAALLTVELRSQSVPVDALQERLNASAVRDPYNGRPFSWDAADHAVVFTGPEKREYRRQAYPY